MPSLFGFQAQRGHLFEPPSSELLEIARLPILFQPVPKWLRRQMLTNDVVIVSMLLDGLTGLSSWTFSLSEESFICICLYFTKRFSNVNYTV
jgi:hypothetical protein